MSVVSHASLPVHQVPRIKTRVLVNSERAAETAVWEQWIEPGGYIPLHYHEVEEVLVIMAGQVSWTMADETSTVDAPATIVVAAGTVHGLRPAGPDEVHLLAIFPTASPTILAVDGRLRPLPWEDVEGGTPPP